MATYGVTLLVPGDLLRPTADGTDLDVGAMVNDMQTNAAKKPPQTTPFNYDVRFPESAKRATHVYVKTAKKGGLGPIKQGPFPIVERIGKSTLLVDFGKDASGNNRHRLQHWANCQPAALAKDTAPARAPLRGRKPAAPPQGAAPAPRPAPTPPPIPPQPPPVTTRSGRTVKPTTKTGYTYS